MFWFFWGIPSSCLEVRQLEETVKEPLRCKVHSGEAIWNSIKCFWPSSRSQCSSTASRPYVIAKQKLRRSSCQDLHCVSDPHVHSTPNSKSISSSLSSRVCKSYTRLVGSWTIDRVWILLWRLLYVNALASFVGWAHSYCWIQSNTITA